MIKLVPTFKSHGRVIQLDYVVIYQVYFHPFGLESIRDAWS